MVRKMHKSLAEMKGRWVDDRQPDDFKKIHANAH